MPDNIENDSTEVLPETAGNAKKDDDGVGYKKPPKKYQFKKGQSGNPKGGKKIEEILDIRILMEDVLAEQIKVRESGKVKTVSREEAIMNAELINALKGNPKAIEALFKRARACGLFTKQRPRRGPLITEPKGDEGKIVRMFHAEQAALRDQPIDGALETKARSNKRR